MLNHLDDISYHQTGAGKLQPIYPLEMPLEQKIETIAKRIYGANSVAFTAEAAAKFKKAARLGYGELPVCMAKTQNSLSDNPKLLGRPKDFNITVRDMEISAGAGFVVALTGDIVRMPGLPERPAAEPLGNNPPDREARPPRRKYHGGIGDREAHRPRRAARADDSARSNATFPGAYCRYHHAIPAETIDRLTSTPPTVTTPTTRP